MHLPSVAESAGSAATFSLVPTLRVGTHVSRRSHAERGSVRRKACLLSTLGVSSGPAGGIDVTPDLRVFFLSGPHAERGSVKRKGGGGTLSGRRLREK
jgi:hypothetical protein